MNSRRILVTGGSGFLGRHLCRAMSQAGHQVKNLDLKVNPEFETIIADIRNPEQMKQQIKDVDTVFHLAALIEAGESVKRPQDFIDTNISGTLNVLEAMRENGVKTLLFSSTAAIYGEPQRVPIKVDDRTLPINPYGMTKLALEALLSSYVSAHGFTGVALRYFNLYGPEEHHEPETHAIPRFIKQIYEDQPVTVFGDGNHQRDYIYIDDVVDAHLKALKVCAEQPGQYHYFNISTQKPAAVIEVVRKLEVIMEKTAHVNHLEPRPGDSQVLYADASKAREQLGWEAQVDLDDGLRRTVEYFLEIWKRVN